MCDSSCLRTNLSVATVTCLLALPLFALPFICCSETDSYFSLYDSGLTQGWGLGPPTPGPPKGQGPMSEVP